MKSQAVVSFSNGSPLWYDLKPFSYLGNMSGLHLVTLKKKSIDVFSLSQNLRDITINIC